MPNRLEIQPGAKAQAWDARYERQQPVGDCHEFGGRHDEIGIQSFSFGTQDIIDAVGQDAEMLPPAVMGALPMVIGRPVKSLWCTNLPLERSSPHAAQYSFYAQSASQVLHVITVRDNSKGKRDRTTNAG